MYPVEISSWISSCSSISNGPFLNVKQSMFTQVEVANQWHCRAHNNICPTLHKRTLSFLFVSIWPRNEKKTVKEQKGGDLYICIKKCRTIHYFRTCIYIINISTITKKWSLFFILHWNSSKLLSPIFSCNFDMDVHYYHRICLQL